jgi:flagellar basal body-associated protein FliL
MESRDNFEVRVLNGKSGWTTLSTWDNAEDAADEGRSVIASRRYLGVKVVHEIFDPIRSTLRENLLLEHYKLQAKWLAMAGVDIERIGKHRPSGRASSIHDPETLEDENWIDDDELSTDHRAKLVAIALCGFLLLNVGLGILIGTGTFDTDAGDKRATAHTATTAIYDLPSMTMNIQTEQGRAAVRILLSLEVDRNQDISEIEASLSEIMQSVFNNLEGADARVLSDTAGLTTLRSKLKHAIQAAAGSPQIHRVLFKDIRPL